jgi:hypothetical protein
LPCCNADDETIAGDQTARDISTDGCPAGGIAVAVIIGKPPFDAL